MRWLRAASGTALLRTRIGICTGLFSPTSTRCFSRFLESISSPITVCNPPIVVCKTCFNGATSCDNFRKQYRAIELHEPSFGRSERYGILPGLFYRYLHYRKVRQKKAHAFRSDRSERRYHLLLLGYTSAIELTMYRLQCLSSPVLLLISALLPVLSPRCSCSSLIHSSLLDGWE